MSKAFLNIFARAKTVGIPDITEPIFEDPSSPIEGVIICLVKVLISPIFAQLYSDAGGLEDDFITSGINDII